MVTEKVMGWPGEILCKFPGVSSHWSHTEVHLTLPVTVQDNGLQKCWSAQRSPRESMCWTLTGFGYVSIGIILLLHLVFPLSPKASVHYTQSMSQVLSPKDIFISRLFRGLGENTGISWGFTRLSNSHLLS